MPSCITMGLLALTFMASFHSLITGHIQQVLSDLFKLRLKASMPNIGALIPVPVAAVLIAFLVMGDVSVSVGNKEIVLAKRCGESKEESPSSKKKKVMVATLSSKTSCIL